MDRSFLIKPASGNCKMNCEYCFNRDILNYREIKSKGFMKKETVTEILQKLFKEINPNDRVEFAFQGGEPTVRGLDFFQYFVDEVERLNPGAEILYSIQSGGLELKDNWMKFLKEKDFLVGLSLDISPKFHDKYRKDFDGSPTFDRVRDVLESLKENKIRHNILAVLTSDMAKEPDFTFSEMEKLGIKHIQFIPCLSPFGKKSEFGLTPEQFVHFYNRFFQLWKKKLEEGEIIHIQFFDAVLSRILYGTVGICGLDGKCRFQYIIEGDGSVYPCDFYTDDENYLGSLMDLDLRDIEKIAKNHKFFDERKLSDYCLNCNFFPFCHGGCKRMENVIYVNEGDNYCGYRDFLQTNSKELIEIAKVLE